ncbi:MAG: acyl carrier protein [Clostridia bacterium]|jgi:acyl carrier protein|nr:acyl carrier protein [Clostridia bacterium]MBO7400668.1 acyl carrier protein [Clostridia bacterium]MBP5657852.1 acyl carrier protein [Clostridia bacterium]MBQ6043270.1 acyl carrier protein [Clostridia bacterium]MBQ6182319.1 acyl carrier protein [Clostridia bacterium]
MTKEEIIELIAKKLRIDVDSIEDDSNLVNDLGADSIDLVEMLMEIESALDITVSDEEAAELKTVRDVVDFIEEHE